MAVTSSVESDFWVVNQSAIRLNLLIKLAKNVMHHRESSNPVSLYKLSRGLPPYSPVPKKSHLGIKYSHFLPILDPCKTITEL